MQDKNPLSTFGPDLNEYTEEADFSILEKNSDFIYLRASGSRTGAFRTDKKFLQFAKECRQHDIPSGAYHYAKPSVDLTTADSQSDSFMNVLQEAYGEGDYGDLFPVLDVEDPVDKSLTTTQLVNWILRFKERFEKNTRRKLMLYTGLFFIELYDNFRVPGKGYPLSVMPLWIAMYTNVPTNPKFPPNIGGWTRWTMWQYTEEGKLDGVSSPVDLNWGPNNVAYLMPPSMVKRLYAYQDGGNIFVFWEINPEDDVTGYNVFINSLYAGTLPAKADRFTISKSKFNLTKGAPIEVSIEAFDAVGDFSPQRTVYVIS